MEYCCEVCGAKFHYLPTCEKHEKECLTQEARKKEITRELTATLEKAQLLNVAIMFKGQRIFTAEYTRKDGNVQLGAVPTATVVK
jgi:hypothetical protein